jgi:muconate cycloisomerase
MDMVVKGHPYAKAALDIALYDLAGKILEVPVYQFLGGKIREKIPIAHMIGLMKPDDAWREANRVCAEGIGTLQVKGGQDIARDVQLISDLRTKLGSKVTLRLDANQSYPNSKIAIQAIKQMEDCGLDLVEQPVEGTDSMTQVTAAVNCLTIADESVWSLHDALAITRTRAADALSIYIGKSGGLLNAKKITVIAEAGQLLCDINGSLELGVGNAANLHLAVSSKAIGLASVLPVNGPEGREPTQFAGRYFSDDIVHEPFKYKDGNVIIMDEPGLGVEVDEVKIKRYRVA